MGDKMTPIPFSQLVKWIMKEHKTRDTIFGVYRPYQSKAKQNQRIFGRNLEVPVGPAAGPHTQLAQNIAAAYYAGSRFFELKTVQTLDGEDLPVSKPCIAAEDECYNVEWSTELYVAEALEEYIKAWFLLNIMAIEFELGAQDGFQFNMSVGYDLSGIQSEKIDTFIESLKDAKDTNIFKYCKDYLLQSVDLFQKVTKEHIQKISSNICNSVTLSTLHGCPPDEIERIACYLMEEKGLHTFVKCNPTLLGYEFARNTLNTMGYDYVSFGEFHFDDDLQYSDAIPMLKRLIHYGKERKLEFGVKITNTFPVDIKQKELPGEEMYMSGKSLYPLSISLAAKLSEEFDGELPISYSGGADYYNIRKIADTGIWPITIATTLLKNGGYQRLEQIARELEGVEKEFTGIHTEAVKVLAESAVTDSHHVKAIKPIPSRKMKDKVPFLDCYTAPCQEGCPINQDIVAYMQLVKEEKYIDALKVITDKNPLPFITGTICPHNCMNKCARNFYESPLQIRSMKRIAAGKGYQTLIETVKPKAISYDKKAAVVGGGPAGLAAAYFLRREGMEVTVFEQSDCLGGVVEHIIPDFRIGEEDIKKDVELVKSIGIHVHLNTKVNNIKELRLKGYDIILLAVGASNPGMLTLESGNVMNALEFLLNYKKTKGQMNIGEHVAVIGGGNTAMDTARAAKRTEGVKQVSLIYRRTKRYMPADEEELLMAMEDGVDFKELLSPIRLEHGRLICKVMKLSDVDESGRRGVIETDETSEITADTVIAAIGEQVNSQYLIENEILITGKGFADVDSESLESNQENVYVIGDGLNGPQTVVECIRDAKAAATAILKKEIGKDYESSYDTEEIYRNRGILKDSFSSNKEGERCLQCSSICENCAEVCPNRANLVIDVPSQKKHQILHIDYMCNECGNCKSFCPYDSAPYLDKYTLFANESHMAESSNTGFVVLNSKNMECSVRYEGETFLWKASDNNSNLPKGLCQVMKTVCDEYDYLLI